MKSPTQWVIEQCLKIQGSTLHLSRAEREKLGAELKNPEAPNAIRNWVENVLTAASLNAAVWEVRPSVTRLPMVVVTPDGEVRFIKKYTRNSGWLSESRKGVEYVVNWPEGSIFSRLAKPVSSEPVANLKSVFRSVFFANKEWLVYAGLASIIANFLALGASLYSMQVYDRVIPSQGISTLIVLTSGVAFALVIELSLKLARSSIVNHALIEVDKNLAYRVFERLLQLRIDQFPAQIGSLSGQLRGYETVRSFISLFILFITADVPFAFLFLVAMLSIGGMDIAIVPAAFLVVSLLVGIGFHRRISNAASAGHGAGNRKLGLLVETVDGAESIKASGSGWQFLLRWNVLSHESIEQDSKVRHFSEMSSYITAFMQQIAYVLLVATGAYVATKGGVTSGAIVACSILSGRVFAPVAQIPGLMVQWAYAKAAYKGLEGVFKLQTDNHGVDTPLVPDMVRGELTVEAMGFAYSKESQPLIVPSLKINAGEKVAIIGLIGAGKSTLLKILGGIYRPLQGRVLLDGLDVQQICRARLTEVMGYLPQQVRLFHGTLRENLTAGLPPMPDGMVLTAADQTGLRQWISRHPKGLDMQLTEGGGGISGGQRQLIALTRLLLSRPRVWLMDEPTASMDNETEFTCLAAMKQAMQPSDTLVFVTHKPAVLDLVNRIIVMGPQGIVLDGPKEAVLARLSQQPGQAPQQAHSQAPAHSQPPMHSQAPTHSQSPMYAPSGQGGQQGPKPVQRAA